MNLHELKAWTELQALGAVPTEIGGKRALDLRPIRVTSGIRLGRLLQAFNEVVGRSGANRRHLDRRGVPVFVVTDGLRP